MEKGLQTTITLNNGVRIPIMGLGVFRAKRGEETRQAVRWALELGYRHIDTAQVYGNETDVGAAIRESGVPRDEIFLTTKLWNADHGYDRTLRAFDGSLRRLGLETVDLYLIHWPVQHLRGDSWRALERLLEEGRCRAIGVSNYMIRHLQEVLDQGSIVPAVNQVEVHPFLNQQELRRFCGSHGIVVEAYSPLTKGLRLDHAQIVAMADKYERSPAQILIRWALQHDLVVLAKSSRRERIAQNCAVFDFDISPGDMEQLDALNEDLHTGWDPSDAP